MHNFTSSYQAAIASMIAFSLGSLLPLLTITFAKHSIRVPLTVVSVVVALAITGYAAAAIGKSSATAGGRPQRDCRTINDGRDLPDWLTFRAVRG